jgi:hypothetical protein
MPHFHPTWLVPVVVAALVWMLESRGLRLAATLAVAAGAALGVGFLKTAAAPELDQRVSTRRVWREVSSAPDNVCLGDLKRDWIYGLNYYAGRALPSCKDEPKPLQIVSFENRLMVAPDRP